MDKGDSRLGNDQLKDESTKLIKYFLASLTIPEKDLWVNLSPYEKDRIIPTSFGLTGMGRDLLAEDYMLKQITASLIYPEGEVGKKFWKRIYEEAAKKFGTTNIPVNTFNKVWILPEKAVVYENAKAGTAYVVESKLKVMLEQDYLSLEKHEGIQATQRNQPNAVQPSALGSQIVREIVIPELTREVNEGKNFAQLRQVYNSLILATWYKKKIKDSILSQVYADKNKVTGVNIDDPQEKERIYQRYLRAFKKGVFNYIKEDAISIPDMPSKEQGIFPRKYFSGGEDLINMDSAMNITQLVPQKFTIKGSLVRIFSKMDAAMDVPHYADRLKFLNPEYVSSYEDSPPSRIGNQDMSVNVTQPMKVKGLDELLSEFNKETINQHIEVVMLGAGNAVAYHPDINSSPQAIEIIGALSNGRQGVLDFTIVDRSPKVLEVATGRDQKYVSNDFISDSVNHMVTSHNVIAGRRVYNIVIHDNTNLESFRGSFQELMYGENQVNLIIATNSLIYSYRALNYDKGAYLALILSLIRALKPSGKLLIDRPSLAAFMPQMGEGREDSIIKESDAKRFEGEVQKFEEDLYKNYGVDIRLRFYDGIVEIEKLPNLIKRIRAYVKSRLFAEGSVGRGPIRFNSRIIKIGSTPFDQKMAVVTKEINKIRAGLRQYFTTESPEFDGEISEGLEAKIYYDARDPTHRRFYKIFSRGGEQNEDEIVFLKYLESKGVADVPRVLDWGFIGNDVWAHMEGIAEAQSIQIFNKQTGELKFSPIWTRLSFPQRLAVLAKVAKILSEVHKMGISDNDVKPLNIIINDQGDVMVIDWNIAVKLGQEQIMGTTGYRAPEEIIMLDQTDVYGLGKTIYYSLVSSPEYLEATDLARCLRNFEDEMTRPNNEANNRPSMEESAEYLGEIAQWAVNPQAKPEAWHPKQLVVESNQGKVMKTVSHIVQRAKRLIGKDAAMTNGGIDLTPANMNVQTQNAGEGIKFHMDPAILQQLQNAPGFVPVIINIQPMTDLRQFLGIQESVPAAG